LTNFFSFFPITGIKGSLTAAGLSRIIGDGASRLFKNLDHTESCIRIQLINETGYEKLNVQRS